MQTLFIEKLINIHTSRNTLVQNNICFWDYNLFNKSPEEVCTYLSILILFDKITLHVDDYQSFVSFSNWLKINYKGLYGWQKIRQVFIDKSSEISCNLVEQIRSLPLPSTFEIPSNWIIYAPISR